MPILMLALVALAVFLVMGVMLFGATIAERRDRKKQMAAGAEAPAESEAKSKAIHA